uniref:NADH-ubiquinone oxidoreductase chain 2 n=1 Tax=Omophoita sp. REN-2018 TaxID=2506509 RepID=A0A411D9X5_9CUCU|nr:NADH dehydrogenase subunit 2 [Omophoita sp. REN-2018]
MLKIYKILFFNTMIMGTLITISAYSWFSMWIGLEINLLSILPLFKSNNNLYPTESMLKYFITQALASMMILFTIIMSMNLNEFIPQNSNYWLMMIMNSALFTKLGAAPFHFWFPEVMEGLNWVNSLLLLTWQKLAPMIIIMYNLNMKWFISFIIIISSIVGGLLGLNQISLRKIMAYSSINHMAWMLSSMMNFKMIWLIYFIIYSIMSLNIILIFKKLNIFFLKQLFLMINYSKPLKILLIMNFFSLGGLPPFIGFFPKWLTIYNLIESNFYMLSFILIIFTLITLFFYIRICFTSLTFNLKEPILLNSKLSNNFILMNFFILMSLIICINLFQFL